MRLLGLEKKLQGQQLRIKLTWGPRLGEVVANLVKKFPGMSDSMLTHPAFIQPAHVSFALALTGDSRKKAARLFLNAASKDVDFLWSPELVELLTALPKEDYRPVLRTQWSDYGLREAILPLLLRDPEVADRGRFFDGLDSSDKTVIFSCLDALQKLPPPDKPEQFVPLLRRLRLSLGEPKDGELRGKLMAQFNRQMGSGFKDLDVVSSNPGDLFSLTRKTSAKPTRPFLPSSNKSIPRPRNSCAATTKIRNTGKSNSPPPRGKKATPSAGRSYSARAPAPCATRGRAASAPI